MQFCAIVAFKIHLLIEQKLLFMARLFFYFPLISQSCQSSLNKIVLKLFNLVEQLVCLRGITSLKRSKPNRSSCSFIVADYGQESFQLLSTDSEKGIYIYTIVVVFCIRLQFYCSKLQQLFFCIIHTYILTYNIIYKAPFKQEYTKR